MFAAVALAQPHAKLCRQWLQAVLLLLGRDGPAKAGGKRGLIQAWQSQAIDIVDPALHAFLLGEVGHKHRLAPQG
ncbi:hypothetical protein D3C72_2241180 [compost metagenome]